MVIMGYNLLIYIFIPIEQLNVKLNGLKIMKKKTKNKNQIIVIIIKNKYTGTIM